MRVTIKKIAQVTGVHPSTVSRALSSSPLVSDARRKQILEVANSLGYRPNLMVRALQGKRTDTVGIVIPMLTDFHSVTLVNYQEAYLRRMGIMAVLAITELDEQTELRAIQNLTDRSVDGLIINYPPYHKGFKESLIELTARKNLPIVVIGGGDSQDYDTVDVDLTKWSFELVSHLIQEGHRRIAKISHIFEDETGGAVNSKLTGYKKALEAHGIEFKKELVFSSSQYPEQDIKDVMTRIMALKDRPTAIFAYSDEVAGALIEELMSAGYKVPEEVSVVGFNDDWFAKRIPVPLTTCRLPAATIGKGAAELLLRRIIDPSLNPTCRMYDCELKIRASTARLSAK